MTAIVSNKNIVTTPFKYGFIIGAEKHAKRIRARKLLLQVKMFSKFTIAVVTVNNVETTVLVVVNEVLVIALFCFADAIIGECKRANANNRDHSNNAKDVGNSFHNNAPFKSKIVYWFHYKTKKSCEKRKGRF